MLQNDLDDLDDMSDYDMRFQYISMRKCSNDLDDAWKSSPTGGHVASIVALTEILPIPSTCNSTMYVTLTYTN